MFGIDKYSSNMMPGAGWETINTEKIESIDIETPGAQKAQIIFQYFMGREVRARCYGSKSYTTPGR